MMRPFIASVLISLSAEASHLDTVCKTALIVPPTFGDGIVSRLTPEYQYVIEDFEGNLIRGINTKVVSLVKHDGKMWVLTRNQLLEMKMDGTLIKGHDISMNRNMTLAGKLLVIVGFEGVVTAFNTESGEVAWTSHMEDVPAGESVAAAYDGVNVHLAMQTAYQGGYTGIVTIDPATGAVLNKTPYDVPKAGVIASDTTARWFNGSLVLNNSGWIHVITSKQLAAGKAMKPRWVAHRLSPEENPYYMMLSGEFFFEGNELVGCGKNRTGIGSSMEFGSALYRVKMP